MPMQKRAECTRHRLIQAAAEVIDGGADALGGVDPLPGMELISRTAGVSKGALYYHFKSKEELLEAVGAEARRVLSALVAVYSRADAAEVGLQAVISLGAAVARRLDSDPVCRAGIRLSCSALRLPVGEAFADWMQPVEALLAAAAERGELRAGVRPREAASALLVLALGGLALCESNPDRSRVGTVSELWATVLPMLAAPELADTLGRNSEFI